MVRSCLSTRSKLENATLKDFFRNLETTPRSLPICASGVTFLRLVGFMNLQTQIRNFWGSSLCLVSEFVFFMQWILMDSSEDPSDACIDGDASTSGASGYRLFDRRATIHQIMGGGKGNGRLGSSGPVQFSRVRGLNSGNWYIISKSFGNCSVVLCF